MVGQMLQTENTNPGPLRRRRKFSGITNDPPRTMTILKVMEAIGMDLNYDCSPNYPWTLVCSMIPNVMIIDSHCGELNEITWDSSLCDKFVLDRLADTLCYSSPWIIICFSCFLISNIWGFSWSGTSNECIVLFISIQLQLGCFFWPLSRKFSSSSQSSILLELWCTRQLPTKVSDWKLLRMIC